MKADVTDIQLVKACLACKPSAQRALYDRFVQAMYNTVYRYTCNHHDTQDILQNGFTRVFIHLHQYDETRGDLIHWIRKIHIRCALDFLKKKQYYFEDISESTISLHDHHPLAYEHLEVEYILKFLAELNPRDRFIFNMYHIEGYSHEEIADMLAINVNSSRVYLARARKILRHCISVHHDRLSLVP